MIIRADLQTKSKKKSSIRNQKKERKKESLSMQ